MQIIRVARLKTKNKYRDNMPKNKNKVPVILTEDEIMNILNRFSIGMLSDNLDDDDKNLARKLSYALKQVKAGEND